MGEHPFELKIADLQSLDFDMEDLSPALGADIVGGTATLSWEAEAGGGGVTADGIGPK